MFCGTPGFLGTLVGKYCSSGSLEHNYSNMQHENTRRYDPPSVFNTTNVVLQVVLTGAFY
jgi:hypothetical protein